MPSTREAVLLLRRFGLGARKTAVVQNGVYRVVLKNGKTYSLKRMPCSAERLAWIDRALRRARRNGASISWRSSRTKEGKRLSVTLKPGGPRFVLSPWLNGRWPNPRSTRDMQACGAALASFHKAAGGAVPAKGAENKLRSWPGELREQHVYLTNMLDVAKRNGYGRKMDRLLRQYGRELTDYSREAQTLLRSSSYRNQCAKNRTKLPLCHGDGGPSNFILNKSGTHLIDFETLRIDLRAYDLYRIVYNACKDNNWSIKTARALLDGYQTISRLKPSDIALMQVWLRFPRTAYLVLRQFNHHSPKVRTQAERELPAAMGVERRMAAFLKKLGQYGRGLKQNRRHRKK